MGAGMAGASAARRLAEAGFAVSVFDKGRQVGGRMASRRDRESGLRFDHGAQILRAHGPAFRHCLDDWRARGIVAPWDAPGTDAAVPDMTAPVRDLLAGLEVHVGRTVTSLTRDAAGWRLALAEAPEARVFDALVLTPPAPQTERLLGSMAPNVGAAGFAGLREAAYAPCWSLMLATQRELPFAGDVLRPDEGPIAAVFRESAKPGRSETAPHVTLHASPEWSAAHLEETPAAVEAALLAALGALLGLAITPTHRRAHRWRYALVTATCGAPYLYDAAARLGYAGDACLGPRVEAAYDSGAALAERLAADLA